MPERHYDGKQRRANSHHHHSLPDDLSSEWKVVKPRRWWRKRALPSSTPTSMLGLPNTSTWCCPHTSLPAYKEVIWGKCFCYLATDHRIADCHDPPRCLNCLASGHFAHSCRQPRITGDHRWHRHSTNPPIHSRLTFPAASIHNSDAFPPLTNTPPALPPAPYRIMASSLSYVPGLSGSDDLWSGYGG